MPLHTLFNGLPCHSFFVSGGRLYGGSPSSLSRPIEPSGSISRMPFTAAAALIPPPTIKYLYPSIYCLLFFVPKRIFYSGVSYMPYYVLLQTTSQGKSDLLLI